MRGKRWITTLIVTAMILICAGTVYADKTITGLGTGRIGNPQKAEFDYYPWIGDYVYYGKYNGSPVKYRVLDKASPDFGVTGGSLLLDCDSVLLDIRFDNDGISNTGAQSANEWAYSDARKELNGDAFLNMSGVFTDAEKAAIAESTKTEAESNDGLGFPPVYFAPLKGDKIFLLDAKEITRESYGYYYDDGISDGRIKSEVKWRWWLRSPDFGGNCVGCVDTSGFISKYMVNYTDVGASPAFNVSLSSILFSSLISGTAGSTHAEYKLTLKDSNLKIEQDGDIIRECNNNNTVKIPYKVTNDTDNGITANQVSVLMTNASWTDSGWNIGSGVEPQYSYAKLNDDGTLVLPSNYESLNIYIIAEQVNGEKETDYASKPFQITVPEPSHSWKAATCTVPKTCSVCGETEGKPLGHNMEMTSEVKATCTTDGTKAYWTCKTCKKMFSDKDGKTEIAKPEAISKTGHSWGEWKTTKEPTETTTGEKQRVCQNDGSHIEKETIPVKKAESKPTSDTEPKSTQETEPKPTPETESKSEVKNVSGTPLAKMTAKGKNSLKITWNKVDGAEGYDIFFAACGKNDKKTKCKLVKTLTGNNKFSWTKTKLKAKKAYKAYVKAWVVENGKKKYVGTSPSVHAFTANANKTQTNAKSVTVEKTKISVKKGKTKQIKVTSVEKVKSKLELMGKNHAAKLRYLSTNKKIATVNKKGKIKGISKGSCYVYVYAHNGVSRRITVKVN